MTNATQSVMFSTAPSENNVSNVIASQPRTLYLNKPKHHKEEEDVTVPENPDEGTSTEGNNNSSEPNHDWEKRYKDLQSYTAKQKKDLDIQLEEKARLLAEKEKSLESLQNQPIKLPSTPAEVEEFKLKYGALYNIIETIAQQSNLSTKSQLEKAIKENETRTKQLSAAKAMTELLQIHPDAESLKSDPEFLEWYKDQVPSIKSLIESPTVNEVARGIDIYKKDKGIVRKTRTQKENDNRQASMAVTTKSTVEVGTGGGKIWRASEVNKIPASKYGQYEAEILKAYAEGRYDENS